MKKMLALLVMALSAGLASQAVAGGSPDPTKNDHDCANAKAGQYVDMGTDEEGRADPLRGSICVSDGDPSNGAEIYIGGEIGTEANSTPTCGAIEIMGEQGPGVDSETERQIFGDDNWDKQICQ